MWFIGEIHEVCVYIECRKMLCSSYQYIQPRDQNCCSYQSLYIHQVLFLPTTNWLTNISSNADVSTAGPQSSSGQNINDPVVETSAFDDMFVSQFVVGRKRTDGREY